MSLRVGLVGCGVQGKMHLRSFRELGGTEIVSLCDIDPARREAAGQEFEVAHRYGDYRAMLEAQRFDLVSVCTMSVSHREIAVAALEAGAHVLCEKPMAMNLDEAQEMVRAAERAGRFITVGFNMRYLGAAQALKRFVVEGRLGRPLYTHAWTVATDIPWWGKHYVKAISGGGVLASTAVHILDLALWIADSPAPATASASMTSVFPRKRATTAPSPVAAEAYDVEDMLAGHVRFTDGSWMTLQGAWAWDAPANSYSFEMVGETAAIQYEPARVVIEEDGAPVERTAALLGDLSPLNNWPQSVTAHIGAVLAAVRSGEEPPVTVQQALSVQQLVDALYRSAETGREVVLVQ